MTGESERQIVAPGRGARVLVTGAGGGLGAHLICALIEQGYRVRAVDRVSRAEASLCADDALGEEVEWVRANLEYVQDLGALVEGCEAIIHAAALVSLTEEYEAFVGPNVELTRRLWGAGQRAGVTRFVLVSCGAVYRPGKGLIDEGGEVDLANGYERSKHAAEQVLARAGARGWTILRPALLYGPYCSTMSAGLVTLPAILRQFSTYLPGVAGGPRTNWCHAEDAARAAVFVLGRPEADGELYNVGDATPLGFGEVITSITEALGLAVGPVVPFPTALTRGIFTPLINQDVVFDTARMVLRQLWKRVQAAHMIRSPLRPRVERKALIYTSDDLILDAGKLRALGWRPRWPDLREGIVETVRWYQARGWIPRYDTQTMLELQEATRTRGLAFNEELRGVLELEDGQSRGVLLDLDVAFEPVRSWATRIEGTLDGSVWIRGLAAHVPLQGTMTVDWLGRGKITYEFGFRGDGDETYRFQGVKHLSLLHPLDSLEKLEGELIDRRGRVVGVARLRFEMGAQIVPFLVSLRFLMRQREEHAA